MKRAQISIQTIVYVAIALLVLAMVVLFATGGLSNLFGQTQQAAPGQTDTARTTCLSLCNQAKLTAQTSGPSAWGSTSYCRNTFALDLNGDGSISEAESETTCTDLGVTCNFGNLTQEDC